MNVEQIKKRIREKLDVYAPVFDPAHCADVILEKGELKNLIGKPVDDKLTDADCIKIGQLIAAMSDEDEEKYMKIVKTLKKAGGENNAGARKMSDIADKITAAFNDAKKKEKEKEKEKVDKSSDKKENGK